MDDLEQARERGGRLDELPEHERDDDVASQAGAGLTSAGGTAEVRGTGERTGNAQGLDEEATATGVRGEATGDQRPWDVVAADPTDATPGIRDFTDEARGPGDGAAGRRSGRLEDDPGT
jgi:hypothetical protein